MGLRRTAAPPPVSEFAAWDTGSQLGRLGALMKIGEAQLAEQRRTNELLEALLERQTPPPRL